MKIDNEVDCLTKGWLPRRERGGWRVGKGREGETPVLPEHNIMQWDYILYTYFFSFLQANFTLLRGELTTTPDGFHCTEGHLMKVIEGNESESEAIDMLEDAEYEMRLRCK